MSLYEEAFGSARVTHQVACFEDHFVLIDSPLFRCREEARLAPAAFVPEMVEAAEYHGIRYMDRVGTINRVCVIGSLLRNMGPGDIIVLTDSMPTGS